MEEVWERLSERTVKEIERTEGVLSEKTSEGERVTSIETWTRRKHYYRPFFSVLRSLLELAEVPTKQKPWTTTLIRSNRPILTNFSPISAKVYRKIVKTVTGCAKLVLVYLYFTVFRSGRRKTEQEGYTELVFVYCWSFPFENFDRALIGSLSPKIRFIEVISQFYVLIFIHYTEKRAKITLIYINRFNMVP